MKYKDKSKNQLLRELEESHERIEELEAKVTQLKLAEEELREREQRYRTLVANLPIGVSRNTPGPRGEILMANPTCVKYFGFESEEKFKQVAPVDVYMDPDDRKRFSDTVIKEGAVSGFELALKRKDGTPFWGSVTTTAVYEKNGEVAYFDSALIDISDQKRSQGEKEKLEAQLRQAQKLEAIGTLAGGIAHNFNNLLMGILGNVSLMLFNISSEHPHYEGLKAIKSLVDSAGQLTSQLLGYVRKGKLEVKTINVNEVVIETAEAFGRTRRDIVIHPGLYEGLYAIEADKAQIEQMLWNLYVNAADAMPNGGELTLNTSNISHEDMGGKLYEPKPGNYVLLTISDTGIGIDKKTQDRIFEPFFTTKETGKGTGLGLASTYGIVKGHGGYIDVKSERGKGTTFSIYLPGTEKNIQEDITTKAYLLNGSETILLVDDEDFVLEVGMKLLKLLGYSVLVARGGKQAIDIYRLNNGTISLVILDMIMPGMGGGETYDCLKRINADVKVILSSGYSIEGQAREILERGCNGFLQKPFKLEEISRKIREVLGS